VSVTKRQVMRLERSIQLKGSPSRTPARTLRRRRAI
jgi:hypothetical protein